MKPVIIIAIAFVLLIPIPAFAQQMGFFENKEFGFSITYPINWVVDDEVVETDPLVGFDEGFFSIVYFYDDPNIITDSIEVTWIKNDNIARNNQGQQYLDRVESRLAENCEIAVFDYDEYECSNFKVISGHVFEHKGLPSYKLVQTWTEHYIDGSSVELKSILVDIVDGDDVWTIDGISIESEFPKFLPILNKVIESFTITPILGTERVYAEPEPGLICGTGTIENNGQCVPIQTTSQSQSKGGGCLIATSTYGSELAPQVQLLREIRDNSLLQTESGTNFMNSFNDVYYSFSPVIADYERENPVFREAVKIVITPMITSLSILNYVDMDSEESVLGYGISLILLNGMMYVGIPASVIVIVRRF